MKSAAEMGSGAMTYILSFIKICSGIQKLIGGFTDRLTDNMVISSAHFITYVPYFERIKVDL
jgi:hypothetical protein